MEDDKRALAAVKQSVYYRNYRRARDRALVRLAQAHVEEYRSLMQEERIRDEENGKTWSSDRFNIIPPLGTRLSPREASLDYLKQAIRDDFTPRNNEGEGEQ